MPLGVSWGGSSALERVVGPRQWVPKPCEQMSHWWALDAAGLPLLACRNGNGPQGANGCGVWVLFGFAHHTCLLKYDGQSRLLARAYGLY